ncbi:hypothetical protein J2X31_002004 [Flavobacterium arsenatis]|uniref:Uncharacterized protein n=1 Tax=Flavobacterium arsenatis TaxID=1484332 RepID=A0ABU1TPT4_9FLAO|nr:hypothetical protein [Flavobacterium arsenatis]MDR6967990.1 hypothetical protein [Flavobacterium arsenatis]
MKIYQSCGELKIDSSYNEKILTPRVMLPNLKHNGSYEFTGVYNISNGKHYGVLGVLKINGEPNIDLREYKTDKIELTQIGGDIDLNRFSSFNGGLNFSNLDINKKVTFVCYHDDNFDYNNPDDYAILIYFQKKIDDTDNHLQYEKTKIDSKMWKIPDPKIGNGGVLTVDGCRF